MPAARIAAVSLDSSLARILIALLLLTSFLAVILMLNNLIDRRRADGGRAGRSCSTDAVDWMMSLNEKGPRSLVDEPGRRLAPQPRFVILRSSEGSMQQYQPYRSSILSHDQLRKGWLLMARHGHRPSLADRAHWRL